MPCNCRNSTASAMCYHNADWTLLGTQINQCVDLAKSMSWNTQEGHDEVVQILDYKITKEAAEQTGVKCTSDADEEILLFVQFSSFVRLKGISIHGAGDSSSPAHVVMCTNTTGVPQGGFDTARNLRADAELSLPNSARGEELIHKLDAAKFINVGNLVLLFDQNWGNDETQLVKIEFFGEDTGNLIHRKVATNVVYESMANPADHRDLHEDQKKKMNMIQ